MTRDWQMDGRLNFPSGCDEAVHATLRTPVAYFVSSAAAATDLPN